MADKTKKTEVEEVVETKTEAKTEAKAAPKADVPADDGMVTIRVPLKGKEDTMFVGVNFKNWILKRGSTVRVPKMVAEVIRQAEKAEEEANKDALARESAYFEKAANPVANH